MLWAMPRPPRYRRTSLGRPRTFRLPKITDDWLTEQALTHPYGVSGIVRDALAFYRQHLEDKSDHFFFTIVSEWGFDEKEQSADVSASAGKAMPRSRDAGAEDAD